MLPKFYRSFKGLERRGSRAILLSLLGFVSAWLPNLAGASFPPTPAWVIHNAQVRAIPYYLEQLDEPLSTKRLAALKELAQVGSDADEAIPKLIALLDKDEVPRVRAVSAAILGMMGRRAEAATPALIRGLDHENKFVRAASAQALGSMGTQAEAAISKLIELAKDDYSDVQKEAISALGKIGPAAENALSILTERLQDKDSDIRSRAALAIGGLGEKGKVAASALTELLRAGVKAAARSAAAPEPAPDPRNTRMVSYYTVNDDLVVGCAAARALGELGSVSGMAVPDLVQAIAPRRSENPSENYVITELRIDAMLALANIGGLTREAISQLIESLGDGGSISGSGQPRVRKAVEEDDNSYYPDMIMIGDAAAYALGRIGGDATGSLLQLARNNLQEIKDKPAYDNAIRDSWPRLQNVFIALGAAGGHDPHVISFLIESLQDVNARQYSLLALGEIGPAASEAIPAILKLKPKTDSDWFPYAHVLNAYAKIENPDKAAATLMDYACDTACPVEKRCKAIRTLQQCESAVRDWTPIIQLIGAKGEQTIIRKESVRLSARIKPLGHAAISKLIGVLDEHLEEERGDWWGTTSEDVRDLRGEVIRTLGMIGPQAHDAIEPLSKILLEEGAKTQFETFQFFSNKSIYASEALARIDTENGEFYRAISAVGPATARRVTVLAEIMEDNSRKEWHRNAMIATSITAQRASFGRYISPMATSFSEIDDVYVDMAPLGSLVVSRLHSTDRQEQLWAVRVLENSGEDAKDTVWDLVKLLETNDDELRNAALSAIWHVGRPYDDVPPLLVPYFRSSDPKIRREASECIKLFGEQGHKVTGLWLEALHDPDLGIRMDAAQALEHIVSEHPDERIFAEFLRILQDPLASAEIRAWAASGLSRLRPPSAEAVDALTSASQSSDEALARCANSSLSELEKGKADSIKNVLQSYRSSTGEKRQAIVRRLGALGVQASEAVPELLKDMEGPDEYLAEAAAEALALIAPEMPRPILVLNMMLYYDNQSIACIAADFLEKKVDSKSTPGILEGLKNPGSARWALSRLSRFGPQDKRAIPLLLEGLKNDHPDVRKGACVGLGKIGDATPEVIAGLESGLTDKDDKVRGCATIALLNLDPESERGIKSLAELITSGDRETRIAIIVASTDLKRSDEQVIEAIKKAESDEDANVRNTAKDSLLKIRKGNAAKNLQ